MRNTVCEINNILIRINSRLDIAEEKISKLKDTAVEIIINKTQRKKREKMNWASITCGTTSSILIHMLLEFSRKGSDKYI